MPKHHSERRRKAKNPPLFVPIIPPKIPRGGGADGLYTLIFGTNIIRTVGNAVVRAEHTDGSVDEFLKVKQDLGRDHHNKLLVSTSVNLPDGTLAARVVENELDYVAEGLTGKKDGGLIQVHGPGGLVLSIELHDDYHQVEVNGAFYFGDMWVRATPEGAEFSSGVTVVDCKIAGAQNVFTLTPTGFAM